MNYIIDIIAFVGLIIFSYGLGMIYLPLAPIAFGLVVMLFCIKLSSIKIPTGKKQ